MINKCFRYVLVVSYMISLSQPYIVVRLRMIYIPFINVIYCTELRKVTGFIFSVLHVRYLKLWVIFKSTILSPLQWERNQY
jgi:hypothetical protein